MHRLFFPPLNQYLTAFIATAIVVRTHHLVPDVPAERLYNSSIVLIDVSTAILTPIPPFQIDNFVECNAVFLDEEADPIQLNDPSYHKLPGLPLARSYH